MKALVIDDDSEIAETVRDILTSLGHRFDHADSFETARTRLDADEYAYYLVDLEIPVRAGRGLPRIQNGENLIEEINRRAGERKAPIIVMTAHGRDGPDLAVEVMKKGAMDFITKPFPTNGNTLDKKISEALARSCPPTPGRRAAPGSTRVPTPYCGGDLVFFAGRVELCGVKVCGGPGSGQIRRILDLLSATKPNGKCVALSGDELAAKIKCEAGQNGIASCIRRFRQQVADLLMKEANVVCGQQDVIQSGGAGYRLAEKIRVIDGQKVGSGPEGNSNGPVGTHGTGCGTVASDAVTVGDDDTDAERRQAWILSELGKGRRLKVPAIAAGLRCSPRTVKRDLEILKNQGRVEFVGPARTGHYRLKGEWQRF